MKVRFSIAEHDAEHPNVAQTVNFFYAFDGREPTASSPQKASSYSDLLEDDDVIVGMNYTYTDGTIKSPAGESSVGAKAFSNITVYKREIWNEDGEEGAESIYHPVVINSQSIELFDYNVSNHRTYEYIAYPSSNTGEISSVTRYVSAAWQFWSLTELHPVDNADKKFTAEPKDVWLFKYNVEPGDQTQNISKTQVENLTAYPTFVHGPANYMGSSVSALIGSEMISFELLSSKYVLSVDENGKRGGTVSDPAPLWTEITQVGKGGYTEKLRYQNRLTSNEKIDMIKAWREVAYSGNPKLLKDMKGNSYLVQITSSSNSTQYGWSKMPDTISFDWVEIGTLEGVIITNPEAVDNNI